MKPETIIAILIQCQRLVPQYVMAWDSKAHCFVVYTPKKGRK